MIKLKQLTSSIRTEVKVIEPTEDGGTEELVHSPKHKRLTVKTIQELDLIASKVNQENKNANKSEEDSEDSFTSEKIALAEQLAFLVEETDIWDENNEQIPPSVDCYMSCSHNYLHTTFWQIMGSALPTKKNMTTSANGMSEAEESEKNQVG